mgnify:CR=1 FL=1
MTEIDGMTDKSETGVLPAADIAITQRVIDAYAAISGDFNPIHVDQAAAAATPFGGTIAHGCIPMEPIFRALHRWLGQPTLPPSTVMSLRYHRPSRPGDIIRVEAHLEEPSAGDIDRVVFVCLNQRSEKVIDGECRVPKASDVTHG